jgi:histidinol-phosphate aminotransferase
VSSPLAAPDPHLFRPALEPIAPYEGGKPVEEVQRELGLERVVKLASNEGPYGLFPAAREALVRATDELNRYPDGNAYRLRAALAERHGVRVEEIVHGSGADGVLGYLAQALLDPGDEVVFGWPSFASYPLHALKMGAVPRPVPLRDHTYDLEALLTAVGPRTKIVYVCTPNNPTGTMSSRAELAAFLEAVPGHVLTVVDQAYFEYVDEPDYPDAIEEHVKAGRRVLVLRTFSKIYGLAGLRVGYGVGHESIVTAIAKVRPAFDVSLVAQEVAIASLGDPAEVARRRTLNREGRVELEAILRSAGLEPVGPAVANFLFVETGADGRALFEALLRQGVIVRPMHGFGAPSAVRITVGTPEEHAFLAEALARVGAPA